MAFPLRATALLSMFWLPIIMLFPEQFGFYLVGGWIATCVLAALGRHALIWSIWTLGPLALLCLDWLVEGYPKGLDEDPFSIQLSMITLFLICSAVTAVSGVIFLISAGAFRGSHVQGSVTQ